VTLCGAIGDTRRRVARGRVPSSEGSELLLQRPVS
jgi:hypothetical protein